MPEDASSPGGAAPRVLVVEDDADVRAAAALLLRRHGFEPCEAETPAQALALAAERPPDAVLLDLNFRRGATGGEEGLACLADLRLVAPQAEVVVVTAHSGVAMAVAAVRAGAADFVTKPWSNRRLVETLERAVARSRAARGGPAPPAGPAWLGESPAAAQVRARVARAGPLHASVLVHGPAGAGKSLVARLLHAASPRAAEPLREVDLAAEDVDQATAALEVAHGAVVLANPEALTPAERRLLLAALDRPERPRVIAASLNGPAVLQARLGGELAYRLAVLDIEAPPLARRGEDAALLAAHWLAAAARTHGLAPRGLSPEARGALLRHAWSDDARGLRLAVERAAVLGEGPVRAEELVGEDMGAGAPAVSDLNLQQNERTLLQAALTRRGFNVSHAARDLGLTRAALYRRMAKHGL